MKACVLKDCKHKATHYIPADLCTKHWNMWFAFNLVVIKKRTGKPYAYVVT